MEVLEEGYALDHLQVVVVAAGNPPRVERVLQLFEYLQTVPNGHDFVADAVHDVDGRLDLAALVDVRETVAPEGETGGEKKGTLL